MKGSVGTSTYITYVGPKKKQKRKAKKVMWCCRCRGYIQKDEWFNFTRNGYRQHWDTKCKSRQAA